MTNPESARPVGYRWVALAAFSFVQAAMQVLWVSFAPITSQAAEFYQVTPLKIGLLSLLFMLVYLVVSIPASWAIDTYGVRKGTGLGVVLMGIFGLVRGFGGGDYTIVLMATIVISIAQPFVLNAVTAMSARWFPLRERATAAGIAVLAQFVGIVAAMAVTPPLFTRFGLPGTLKIYGVVSALSAVVFLILVKDGPPVPPEPEADMPKTLVWDGLKHIFRQRDMILLLVIMFIGLGIFNAVTTWIEQMVEPRGFSINQAGLLGAVMMVAGILGAAVVPIISDKTGRRKLPVLVCLAGACPGLVGLTFAQNFPLLLISGATLGFFLLGGGPVIYQYGAEISYPAPEATSQGLLLMAGQVSGILFIFGMDAFRSAGGSMTPSLIGLIVLMVLNVLVVGPMKESRVAGAGGQAG